MIHSVKSLRNIDKKKDLDVSSAHPSIQTGLDSADLRQSGNQLSSWHMLIKLHKGSASKCIWF